MKFDDISYDDSNNNYEVNLNNKNRKPIRRKKTTNTTYLAIGIALIVFILVILLFSKSLFSKPSGEQPQTSTIDINSRISKSLYKKVHDFDNKNPFWMYSDDELGLVSEMKETTRMSLVYINLKFNDLKVIPCTSIPDVDSYDNYECKESTVSVSKEVVEDTYRDLFGSDSKLSTSAVMKADEQGNQAYFYEEGLDSYIMLNRKKEIEKENSYVYKYEFIKAVNIYIKKMRLM